QGLAVGDGLELAVLGREPDGDDALDELLRPLAVLDEVGDGDELEPVPLAIPDEVWHAGHRPVLVHDLAHDAVRGEGRKAREIDRGRGLARALEDPAGSRPEREKVAGRDE